MRTGGENHGADPADLAAEVGRRLETAEVGEHGGVDEPVARERDEVPEAPAKFAVFCSARAGIQRRQALAARHVASRDMHRAAVMGFGSALALIHRSIRRVEWSDLPSGAL